MGKLGWATISRVGIGLVCLANTSVYGKSGFSLDLGAYVDNVSQRLSAPAGYSSKVSMIAGLLRARPIWSLGTSVQIEPSFALVIPWRASADGATKKFNSFVAIDFALLPATWLKWRVGTAVQWNVVWGQGESIELDNGTGTATFYAPPGLSSAFGFLVQTGLEFQISSNVSFGLEVWVAQVMSAQRRRFSAVTYLGFSL